MLALTGFAANTVLAYWGLKYTQALNGLLIQSSGPLCVALWTLILFGVRLTLAQLLGIVVSLAGVLIIILRGDLTALASIEINKGDAMLVGGAAGVRDLFGADAEATGHPSDVADRRHHRRLGATDDRARQPLGTQIRLAAIFDSVTLLYAGLCRDLSVDAGLSVLQSRHRADRSESRGTIFASDAGVRLGDGDRLSRRAATAVSPGRLCPGAIGRYSSRPAVEASDRSIRDGGRGRETL